MVMAEFCRECFFKLNPNERSIPVLSKPWDKDLCEGCGKWKRVVVDMRLPFIFDLLGDYGYSNEKGFKTEK